MRFCHYPYLVGLASLWIDAGSAYSSWSSFTVRRHDSFSGSPRSWGRPSGSGRRLSRRAASLLMFDTSRDPPSLPSPDLNAWTVLATTEKWISQSLSAGGAASPASPNSSHGGPGGMPSSGASNPYTRKEVTYRCVTQTEGALIVAGIFKRLREAREMGELHGQQEEERRHQLKSSFAPSTLRQTQVIVIPGNPSMTQSFTVFDTLVNAINRARRNARDYVTDVFLDKLDDSLAGDEDSDRDWSVAVNLAHLHPSFGEKTPEQILLEMKQEEQAGEVDVNLQQYKEKRLQARRSPYPTLVMEVRATPPPDFSSSPPPLTARGPTKSEPAVTAADINKLEALFAQTAYFQHPTKELSPEQQEDAFYASIGRSLEELSSVTPLVLAQRWMARHDPLCLPNAAFTESPAAHVDEAYEFIFTNMAMMIDAASQESSNALQYNVVLPHFLSSAATSFEKFCKEIKNIVQTLPELKDKITVRTLHPEHVDSKKRSPAPIISMQFHPPTDMME